MNDLRLTPEQKDAAAVRDGAVHLMAGAGSGKTTVLVEHYLSLLRQGAHPRQILAVTFTKDAAEQLRERVLFQLQDGATTDLVEAVRTTANLATIHSFCYRVLNQFGSHLGLAPIVGILSVFDRSTLFESAYRTWLNALSEEDLTWWLNWFSTTKRDEVALTLCETRAWCLEVAEPSREADRVVWQSIKRTIAPLLDTMKRQSIDKGLYGFDDLEWYALRLLRECPEVARYFQESIHSFLIDEFQDTSRRQWDILSCLLANRLEKLFLVGDPKQSIYGFRNAEVALFFETKDTFTAHGGVSLELSTNFRARPDLLEEVNSLSERLFSDTEVPFTSMVSGRLVEDQEPGLAAFSVIRFAQNAEITEAVRRCESLLDSGVPPEAIALLFRDLVSFLRVVADPTDDHALAEFLRSPYIGLSPSQLAPLISRPGRTLLERVMGEASVGWLISFLESGELDTERALSALWKSSSYWPSDSQAITALYTGLGDKRMSVIDALERIESWKRAQITYVSQGVSHVGMVRLLTVHGAKGLEFGHVCLVDNARLVKRGGGPIILRPDRPVGLKYRREGELFPTPEYEALKDEKELRESEESKRILYVALTRARDSLTVFLPKKPAAKGTWADWLSSQTAVISP